MLILVKLASCCKYLHYFLPLSFNQYPHDEIESLCSKPSSWKHWLIVLSINAGREFVLFTDAHWHCPLMKQVIEILWIKGRMPLKWFFQKLDRFHWLNLRIGDVWLIKLQSFFWKGFLVNPYLWVLVQSFESLFPSSTFQAQSIL